MKGINTSNLLASGYIIMKGKTESDFEPTFALKYYGKPYIDGCYPIDYISALNTGKCEEVLNVPSIYHLFSKGELVYVGITKCLYKRLSEHRRDKSKEWDAYLSFSVDGLSLDAIREMETKIIKRLQPKYNTQWKDGIYNHHNANHNHPRKG